MFENSVVLVMKLVPKYFEQYVTVILNLERINHLPEVMQYEKLHYSCRRTFSFRREHQSVFTELTPVRSVLSS
jgi:hypothetical protein